MSKTLYINGRFLEEPDAERLSFPWVLLDYWNDMIGSGEMVLAPKMIVLTSRKFDGASPWAYIPVKRAGFLNGERWEQMELPRLAKDGVLFSPLGSGPANHPRHIVRYPDTALFGEPDTFSLMYRMRAQAAEKKMLRNALRVITDTNFSRMQLERAALVPPHLLFVSPTGTDQLLDVEPEPLVLENCRLEPFNYVVAFRDDAPYANFDLLCEAASGAEMRDVRVAVVDRSAGTAVPVVPIPPNMVLLRYLRPGELRALYENAVACVIQHRYGDLPFNALEAIACQCPVICSTSGAYPEVLGASVDYFDPESAEDLSRQIRRKFVQEEEDELVPVLDDRYRWEVAAPAIYELIEPFIDPKSPEGWAGTLAE